MAARFKQGAWLGGLPPLGFISIKDGDLNRLTIDLTEAAVVREVFTRYAEESLGLRRLANMLNERGLRTRKGTLFSQTSTSKILRNELYLGRRTWGKRHHKLNRQTGKHKTIATPDATLVDDCPELAIIDNDLWDRVQERLGQRGHLGFYHLRGKVSPLTGLIHCGACGNVCFSKRVHRVKGGKKTVRRYITCGRRLTHGRDVCDNSTFLREQPLIEAIQARLWEVFGNLDDAVEDTLAETRKIVTANTETLASLKARASTLQVEIDTLGARLADPAAKEAATRAIMKQIGLRDADLQEINVRIAEVATDAIDNTGKIERAVRQAFEEARESLSNVASIKQLHEFFTQHVGPMILTADRKIEQGVSIPYPAPRLRLR
jgi:site-specific DNA recombinase